MTARSDTVRGVVTLLLAALGAALLWSLPIAAPRWSELRSTAGLQTELVDAVGFALWGISTAASTYLVLAASLHLVALACERRSRAPRLRRAARQLTPRWMAVATVGVMTGTSWVAPAAGAAAAPTTGGGERRPDVVMEVISAEEEARSGEAPRTMLPWATQLQPPTPNRRTSSATTAPPVSTVPPVSTAPPATTVPTATSNPPTASNPPTTSVSPSTSRAPEAQSGTAPRLEELDDPATPTDPAPADEARGPLPGQLPPPLAIELEPGDTGLSNRLHLVSAGESFWTIAEQVVAERALPVPVASYWQLLVEANRDRLVQRDDPDLIHPGQELVLP